MRQDSASSCIWNVIVCIIIPIVPPNIVIAERRRDLIATHVVSSCRLLIHFLAVCDLLRCEGADVPT